MKENGVQVRVGERVVARPHVSVIMPAYNVAPYISDAIKSVLAQTFSGYEIVVINDGSPDTTELEAALAPFAEQIVYVKQKNQGVAAARNTGLRVARSPIIAQLDPDDMWLPNFLAVQVEIMERQPSIDVLYANSLVFGDTVNRGLELMALSPSEGEVTFESLISQKCTVLSCLAARRQTLFDVGLFDESLRASEDFDMWLRILKAGGKIGYHRQVLARYRQRKDSLSANPISMCESILQVLDKVERTQALTPEERQSLHESKSKFRAMLSLSEGKKAFFDGNTVLAVEGLKKANKYYRSRKISLSICLLRFVPGLMLQIYNVRDRLLYKANTRY